MSTYLFDFDGTLGDSMSYFTEEMLAILRKNHIDFSEDIVKIITPLGYKGTALYYIQNFNLPYSVEMMVDEMHESLYPVYRDKIVLKPGVEDYLKALKKEGHSLNVLSASPYKMVSAVLERCNVQELFDHVWSCEDFNMTKENPEIYKEAVKRAGGVIADTFFFDDNLNAVKTAVKAGLHTTAVYDVSSEDYVEELQAAADNFIYSFKELG